MRSAVKIWSFPNHALQGLLSKALDSLGPRRRVLVVPPDHTRMHSAAGELTRYTWNYYQERLQAILPALGTHTPTTADQLQQMFGAVPLSLFHIHNWRRDVDSIGEVPADFVYKQSEGRVNYAWPVQANRMVLQGGFYQVRYPPCQGPIAVEIDSNLFFNDLGEFFASITPRGGKRIHHTFDEWWSLGYDRKSLYADPKFVDPENRNFSLRSDSPAHKIGFKPFDMNSVGLRDDFPAQWRDFSNVCMECKETIGSH